MLILYSTRRTYSFGYLCIKFYLCHRLQSTCLSILPIGKLSIKNSVHLSDFCFLKGSPFDVICDISVNTCEGCVHALNPVCLSDFRR